MWILIALCELHEKSLNLCELQFFSLMHRDDGPHLSKLIVR